VNKLLLLATLACAPSFALAQTASFSADLVMTMVGKQAAEMKQYFEKMKKQGMKVPDATSSTSKMYVSGLKMRVDMSAGDQKSSMLADLSQGGKSYLVGHTDKSYIEFDSQKKDRRKTLDIARFLRGGDLCALMAEENPKASCRKLGSKVIDGRSCDEYEGLDERGRKQTMCLDARVHFPLRTVTDSTVTEMKNIVEGSQPASLFVLPAGYAKKELGQRGR
jgi:hypothetical protein